MSFLCSAENIIVTYINMSYCFVVRILTAVQENLNIHNLSILFTMCFILIVVILK